jgi:glycosyltransferase involved in cell wall biosynthesis
MTHHSHDVLCLCTSHSIGGAQGNAARLTRAFRARGYRAALGFLFDDDPQADFGIDDILVVAEKRPRTTVDWFVFLDRCRAVVAARRPRTGIGFHPLANIIGALTIGPRGRFVASQQASAYSQSTGTDRVETLLCHTPLIAANIPVSRFVADSFSHRGHSYVRKTEIIYNEPPPLPGVAETPQQCRETLGMSAGRLVLGCIGRLHEQKNIQLAIRAMSHLPDMHLHIAGDGGQRDMLQRLAAEVGASRRVHFLGALSGADVTRFYQAIDLLLMPSLFEGHPLVMLEAMSQGVPVLAHDIAVMREAGGDAALYASSDPLDWASQIESLAPDRLHVLSAQSRARAAYFSQGSMVDEYLRVLGLPAYKEGEA